VAWNSAVTQATIPQRGGQRKYRVVARPDSAAAATAIATGIKVNNGVISVALPGDRGELHTLLEHFQERDKAVGLVTTATSTRLTIVDTNAVSGLPPIKAGETQQFLMLVQADDVPARVEGTRVNGDSLDIRIASHGVSDTVSMPLPA